MHSEAIESYLRTLGDSSIDPAMPVHPTFLYESLWNFGVFFFLIWYRKRYRVRGELFSFYMLLYGIGRAWIEGLRTDSLYLGPFRISQVLAVVFAITFAVIIIVRHRTSKGEPVYNALGHSCDTVSDAKDFAMRQNATPKIKIRKKVLKKIKVYNKKILYLTCSYQILHYYYIFRIVLTHN